jgi:putative membrane protein
MHTLIQRIGLLVLVIGLLIGSVPLAGASDSSLRTAAEQMSDGHYHDGSHHEDTHHTADTGHVWFGGSWTIIWLLLILITLVAFAVFRSKGGQTDDGAVQSLREQYANGEIDEEEFERRRDILQSE